MSWYTKALGRVTVHTQRRQHPSLMRGPDDTVGVSCTELAQHTVAIQTGYSAGRTLTDIRKEEKTEIKRG